MEVEEKKVEEKKKPVAVWYEDRPYEWKIRFSYIDQRHSQIACIDFPPETIDPKQNVGEWLIPRANPKATEFGWKDCWFWANGFEAVTVDLDFEDLNWMRGSDGSIFFMLESHNCQKEGGFKPCLGFEVIEEKQCVTCKMRPADRLLPCLHMCICDNCVKTMTFCPICRKKRPRGYPALIEKTKK